jgi:tRNA modification GTPase
MNIGGATETICAPSTPSGMGAIAVIRVSGPDSIQIVQRIFSKSIENTISHTAIFGRILNSSGELIDEILLTIFHHGKSFTGEETVEIACHGSTFIQQQIIELLIHAGCRMAAPGEFTLRAYLNGKMDLSQAEAIADLIASKSAQAHKIAMNQMRGGFSRELQSLRDQLIHFASLVELELDFGEEDVEFADKAQLEKLVRQILKIVVDLKSSFSLGNVIKNGVPVTIVGAPNVGKSTLLNTLLNEERAIVSEIAGTTRDVIEDEIVINGIAFRFIDTAGLRKTEDIVESLGIERSYEKARKAHSVLYLLDDRNSDEVATLKELNLFKETYLDDHQELIVVVNKSDKMNEELHFLKEFRPVYIAAKEKKNIDQLIERLGKSVELKGIGEEDVIVSNARHVEALSHAQFDLEKVVEGLQTGITGDFIAMDIRQAIFHLGSITGQISTEDLLGNIFANFCIGK